MQMSLSRPTTVSTLSMLYRAFSSLIGYPPVMGSLLARRLHG